MSTLFIFIKRDCLQIHTHHRNQGSVVPGFSRRDTKSTGGRVSVLYQRRVVVQWNLPSFVHHHTTSRKEESETENIVLHFKKGFGELSENEFRVTGLNLFFGRVESEPVWKVPQFPRRDPLFSIPGNSFLMNRLPQTASDGGCFDCSRVYLQNFEFDSDPHHRVRTVAS